MSRVKKPGEKSVSIKIGQQFHDLLAKLSQLTGTHITHIANKAIEEYAEDAMLAIKLEQTLEGLPRATRNKLRESFLEAAQKEKK